VGEEEWLVNTVMAMYDGAQTVVMTPEGDSRLDYTKDLH